MKDYVMKKLFFLILLSSSLSCWSQINQYKNNIKQGMWIDTVLIPVSLEFKLISIDSSKGKDIRIDTLLPAINTAWLETYFKGYYSNGKRTGKWTFFNENNIKIKEADYDKQGNITEIRNYSKLALKSIIRIKGDSLMCMMIDTVFFEKGKSLNKYFEQNWVGPKK